MADRKNVHEEMICGICSDILKDPKILACAHSFCRNCLIGAQNCLSRPDTSDSLQYEMDQEENDVDCNKIECPDCLQITALNDDRDCSIDRLNTHCQLKERIEIMPPEEKKMVRDRREHQEIMIRDMKEGKISICPDFCEVHEMQQEYYCMDCNITACEKCVNEIHPLHCYDKITVLLLESISEMRSLVQPACEYASRADVLLKKLEQDSESIQSNQSMCREAVFDAFNKVRKSIDEREKILLTCIDEYIDNKSLQVAQQQKNLIEIQDQLYQSIQEIQQILDDIPSDASVLIDKQRLVDDIEAQEQNILDIENSVFKSMFSSTYVGFGNDNTPAIQKHIDMLITLCEYYPDADSGYYSSRVISTKSENHFYVDTVPQGRLHSSSINESHNLTNEEVDRVRSISNVHNTPVEDKKCSLKRSQSTPTAHTKRIWLMKKVNGGTSLDENSPLVPIRYDSLILPTPIVQPESVFDKLSVSKAEIVHPCGVCLGENNSIIVSDVKNHCLRVIASNGKFIGAIGKEGKGSGQFEEPCAVTTNQKAQIFVCQRENPRIQKLTSSGKYIQKFGHKSLRGNNLGEPWGIAIGSNDKFYVSDWDKSCIHVFHSNGRYEDSIQNNSVGFPAGVAMNSRGNLVVADRGNHCLWILETGGNILMRIGSKGHGPGELYLPYGVAIHPSGSIIVSESGNHRISIFSSCGEFLKHFGQKGCEPGMFEYPRHLCITPKGDILVADEQNQRLQLFTFQP